MTIDTSPFAVRATGLSKLYRIGGMPASESFYEQIGRTNYQIVASHATARRCDLSDVYEGLADRFHEVRLALNRLSDSLLNLDDDGAALHF